MHHYVVMDVGPGRLRWRAYALDGELIDSFALGEPQPLPTGMSPLALPFLLLASGLLGLARRRRLGRAPRSGAALARGEP